MRRLLTQATLPAGLTFHQPVGSCGERKNGLLKKKPIHRFLGKKNPHSPVYLPEVKGFKDESAFKLFFEEREKKNKRFIVHLFWCILCILGISKPTLAPGGLDPALFLMLGYLMAIWSRLSRYLSTPCPLDAAPPPICFLSCSGSLEISVGSPKHLSFDLSTTWRNKQQHTRAKAGFWMGSFLMGQWALAGCSWGVKGGAD